MDDAEIRGAIARLFEYLDQTPAARDRLPFVVSYLLARLRSAAFKAPRPRGT